MGQNVHLVALTPNAYTDKLVTAVRGGYGLSGVTLECPFSALVASASSVAVSPNACGPTGTPTW